MRSVPVQGQTAFFVGILAGATGEFVQVREGEMMRSIKKHRVGPAGVVGYVLAIGFLLYVDRTWGWDPEMFPAVFMVNIGLIVFGDELDRRYDTRSWLYKLIDDLMELWPWP